MILGKTPQKAMECGWAPPSHTEKVRSFVTFFWDGFSKAVYVVYSESLSWFLSILKYMFLKKTKLHVLIIVEAPIFVRIQFLQKDDIWRKQPPSRIGRIGGWRQRGQGLTKHWTDKVDLVLIHDQDCNTPGRKISYLSHYCGLRICSKDIL